MTQTLLTASFPNGTFGDPALYVWETNGKHALLFDCGDLTGFSTRQLLKVSHIFLSHCHMDHCFGFDLFLRVHMGAEKRVTIFGPPETSKRIAGKLQGYTWNLISEQQLEFVVVDLDPERKQKITTYFYAKNRFEPSDYAVEGWLPEDPILDVGFYNVKTTMLDHRTPSMAYAIEERPSVGVNVAAIKELKLKQGPWISKLKELFLGERLVGTELSVWAQTGEVLELRADELAAKVLVPRKRHKLAYATDGGASEGNRRALISLVRDADTLYSETCFIEADRALADETKHFTAEFIAKMAQEAGVVRLAPFHFSKRYLNCPENVYQEVERYYQGEVVRLAEEQVDIAPKSA